MAAKSTIKAHVMDYLTKSKSSVVIGIFDFLRSQSLKYHIFRPEAIGPK